uniref:Uncharacterized protein n=1 Tax=Anguilla anguilla TaxID=7936 RepID=A0A0E9UP84_ANGAN
MARRSTSFTKVLRCHANFLKIKNKNCM